MNQGTMSILMLIALFLIMYLLLIRPQRKREKVITNMRSSIEVGDEVVTIGGMIGKVVKTTEEVLTIQLGDKNKVEIYRWGISRNISAEKQADAMKEEEKAERAEKKKKSSDEDEEPKKPARPKKMKKAEDEVPEEAPAEEPAEETPTEEE